MSSTYPRLALLTVSPTKLHRSSILRDFVPRPYPIEYLNWYRKLPLSLVVALAGLGKTILMKTLIQVVLLAVWLTLLASAQVTFGQGGNDPSTFGHVPQFMRFRQLGTEQGLSNSTAWDLMKDSRGYIWIATFDGLNRYDG